MRGARRSVPARHERRAGSVRRVGLRAAAWGFVLALIAGGLAPSEGHAQTIPSISTPTVSLPMVTLPTVPCRR